MKRWFSPLLFLLILGMLLWFLRPAPLERADLNLESPKAGEDTESSPPIEPSQRPDPRDEPSPSPTAEPQLESPLPSPTPDPDPEPESKPPPAPTPTKLDTESSPEPLHATGVEDPTLSSSQEMEARDPTLFFMEPVVVPIPMSVRPPAFKPDRILYVSPRGDDRHNALSPEQPFATISAAAEVVEPGDLVLVRGGTYFEHVHLDTAGTSEKPIVFRAAPDETAVVTYGGRPEGWERDERTGSGYIISTEMIPNYVMDERHLSRYAPVLNLDMLDQIPGSFFYDEEAGTLTVHPLRSLHPEQSPIITIDYSRAGPGERGYEFDKGFWTRAPHVRIEGFHVIHQPIGIQLRIDSTEAWNNVIYGNAVLGVSAHSGKGGVIAGNQVFLNDGSGILLGTSDTIAKGNLAWGNTQRGPFLHRATGGHPHQMALYGSVPNPIVKGNLVVGGRDPAERGDRIWRYKSATGQGVTRHNLLIGGTGRVTWGRESDFSYNTVIGGRLVDRGGRGIIEAANAPSNSVAEANLYLGSRQVEEAGFADPTRWDYRQYEGSPFLGEGAWPDVAPVRFVSPGGSDLASGKTPQQAWQTLGHAARSVEPGQTIYVKPGTYNEQVVMEVRGTAEEPVRFLTHGRGRVVIEGGVFEQPSLLLRNSSHLIIDGFIFQGARSQAIKIEGCSDVLLKNNVFDQVPMAIEAEASTRLLVVNNTFVETGTGVVAGNLRRPWVLRNNLFVQGDSLAKHDEISAQALISERNAFAGPEAEEQLAEWRGIDARFADWGTAGNGNDSDREGGIYEPHPSLVAHVEVSGPDYLLPPLSRYSFAGLGHRPLGARGEAPEEDPVEIAKFHIPYISQERAVAEWTTPKDYVNARVTWTDPSGNTEERTLGQYGFDDALRSTRLTALMDGLRPGTDYEVTLEVWTPDGRRAEEQARFRTLSQERRPTTLHVSAERGSDDNDGLSSASALETIMAAIYQAKPGDTILVAPGVYIETVQLFNGGLSSEEPLTLRSTEPGGAILDQGGILPCSIQIHEVDHVVIDGFRIRGLTYGTLRSGISINQANDIEITNCIFERDADGRVTSQLIDASHVRGLRIHNNLFQSGFNNIRAVHMDQVEIDHNTFYRAGVTAVRMHGVDDPEFRFTNNIFYDVSDRGRGAIQMSRPTSNLTVDHNLYFRGPESKMGLVEMGDLTVRSVEELQEALGVGAKEAMGDPRFLDAPGGDFRLAEDSPAQTMASDGGPVGMRNPPEGL